MLDPAALANDGLIHWMNVMTFLARAGNAQHSAAFHAMRVDVLIQGKDLPLLRLTIDLNGFHGMVKLSYYFIAV